MRLLFNLFLSILCLAPTLCFAEVVEKHGPHIVSAESPISISYLLQILFSFVVVIGFILVMAWLLRRTGHLGRGDGQIIKIISSMSLGMREKILVLEIGKTNIVVGVAPGQVRTLHVMEGGIDINNKGDINNYSAQRGFKQLLQKLSK
jgi:flagellar protein FliO/FliZ